MLHIHPLSEPYRRLRGHTPKHYTLRLFLQILGVSLAACSRTKARGLTGNRTHDIGIRV